MNDAARAFNLLESMAKDLDYLGVILSHHLGGPICISSCGICCQQSFIAPEISAQYIAFNIKTLPLKKREMIESRLEKWLLYEVPGVRLKFSEDGQKEEADRQTEYEAIATLWCPFLDPEKMCLIYPWRDLNCRAWGVTRPMSAICQRLVYEGETINTRQHVGPSNPLVKGVLWQVEELRQLCLANMPEALRKGWLPTMVYRLLKPEGWRRIAREVQESKAARYEIKQLWLITREDILNYANKSLNLEKTIPV